jgi:acyl-homoserine lactone synthase
MTIHILDHMSEAEGPLLRAMFEARKRVFVDLLKWDVPVLAGTWELDHLDDEQATYVIVSDGQGGHLASARLLKTTRPHLLDQLFPELVDSAIPRAADVLEITRFCIDPHQRAPERREARDMLVTALTQHALTARIARYTGVAEIGWFAQIAAFGWDCKALGEPRLLGGRMLAAMEIAIDPHTPALLDARGIWAEAGTRGGARAPLARLAEQRA